MYIYKSGSCLNCQTSTSQDLLFKTIRFLVLKFYNALENNLFFFNITLIGSPSTAVEDEIKEDENVEEDMTNEDAVSEQDETEEDEDLAENSSTAADPLRSKIRTSHPLLKCYRIRRDKCKLFLQIFCTISDSTL